jgi:hypothetical protein
VPHRGGGPLARGVSTSVGGDRVPPLSCQHGSASRASNGSRGHGARLHGAASAVFTDNFIANDEIPSLKSWYTMILIYTFLVSYMMHVSANVLV